MKEVYSKQKPARKPLEKPEVKYDALMMTDVICTSASPDEPLMSMTNAGPNTEEGYRTFSGFGDRFGK